MEKIKFAILDSDLNQLKELLSEHNVFPNTQSEISEIVELAKNKGIRKIEALLILQSDFVLNMYGINEKKKLIIELISELSEDIYCSGWNDGIEYDLWAWGNGKTEPTELLKNRLIIEDSVLVTKLGVKTNLWAKWSESDSDPKAISLAEWISEIEK